MNPIEYLSTPPFPGGPSGPIVICYHNPAFNYQHYLIIVNALTHSMAPTPRRCCSNPHCGKFMRIATSSLKLFTYVGIYAGALEFSESQQPGLPSKAIRAHAIEN